MPMPTSSQCIAAYCSAQFDLIVCYAHAHTLLFPAAIKAQFTSDVIMDLTAPLTIWLILLGSVSPGL